MKINLQNRLNIYYLNILIIYGHASNSRDVAWWKSLNLSNYNIILGDFNLILDNSRDRINSTVNSKTKSGVIKYLKDQLSTYHDLAVLKDNLQMTFYRNNSPCSRLDRCYIHNNIVKLLGSYQVLTKSFNDHQPVRFTLRIPQKHSLTTLQNQKNPKFYFIL